MIHRSPISRGPEPSMIHTFYSLPVLSTPLLLPGLKIFLLLKIIEILIISLAKCHIIRLGGRYDPHIYRSGITRLTR